MKKAALWLIPAVVMTSVGSLTFATSRPIDGDVGKKHDSKLVNKTVPFAHDSEIDTYLTSVRSYMLVPPRDGRFGASRVPTFHGANINSVPGYQKIDGLRKESSLMSYVVGVMPEGQKKSYKEFRDNHPDAKVVVPDYRTTRVHAITQDGQIKLTGRQSKLNKQEGYRDLNNELIAAVNHTKAIVDKEGYDTYSASVKIEGAQGFIMAKAVHAFDKSCYTCHSTIKKGEPIGHVVAVIWNKDRK